MILQPLAENAIVHGLAPHARSGTVEIRAVRENGHLHIAVRDDGPGFPDPGCIRKGIGLTNSEARLEKLYGSAYRFELRNDDPRGATVNLWIPYHLAETAE
jgi:sensor histidine kinase YesM